MATRSYNSSFVTTLKVSLVNRMARRHKNTAVLDSRFKLRWCKDENERTSVKSILTNRLADVNHVPSAVNQHVIQSHQRRSVYSVLWKIKKVTQTYLQKN